MDLVNKYLKLSEAWPGTPEWKKKHDPNYNPYDPEGKARKALKQQPYGYRGKSAEGEEEEKPAEQPAMKKRGRPKKVAESKYEGKKEEMDDEEDEDEDEDDEMEMKSKSKKKMEEAAAEKTYNYAFDKVRSMDAKNPFSKSAKRTMYTKAAKNAFQRMKSSGTKPNLPEEVEQIDELSPSTLMSYYGKRSSQTGKRISAAIDKIEGKPSKSDVYNKGLQSAQAKFEKKRKEQTGMNPQKPRPAQPPAYPLGGRDPASGRSYSEEVEQVDEISAVTHAKYRTAARADIRKTAKNLDVDSKASDRIQKRVAGLARSTGLERAKKMNEQEYESVPASKALQKAHDEERKKRGLPDPSYYLKLAAQKKKEIEDMKKNEETTPPFTPDKKKQMAVAGKYGKEYSTARHLARMGVQAALKDLKKGPEKGSKQV